MSAKRGICHVGDMVTNCHITSHISGMEEEVGVGGAAGLVGQAGQREVGGRWRKEGCS